MAHCYKCGLDFGDHYATIKINGGCCPNSNCNWKITYPCWRKGCTGTIVVGNMTTKACQKCHFWPCPKCGAHGYPCNPKAPQSHYQKQKVERDKKAREKLRKMFRWGKWKLSK